MKDQQIDLSALKNVYKNTVIAKTPQSWNDFYNHRYTHRLRDYTEDEIAEIINSGSLDEQQKLSRDYFDRNGFYKQIILYYATVINYSGLLTPNPMPGKQLSNTYLRKQYNKVLSYLDSIDFSQLFTRMSITALIYGSYFGIIQTLDKDDCIIFDLPPRFCCSRFRDFYGNDIVEFDVRYFNSISNETQRLQALRAYPDFIADYYRRFADGIIANPWVRLPADIGVCFTFYDDGRPLFLNVIPATIQYDESVDTERERELEEVRKILIQHVPHLNDGQLVFEPDEAAEMHVGAVNMMSSNKNLSVLTTYADVDSIVSKTASDNANTTLDKMLQNIYSNAGVSGQLFAPTGSQAIPYSIKQDINLMMILGNKYGSFVTYIVNTLFGKTNLMFKYRILPVGEYNKADYVKDALKLAQSGYSFILPAVAMGMTQSELLNIKKVENEVLEMHNVLIPLSTSYTQSGSSENGTGEAGAPEKALEDKSEKTIQNENAIDNQGASSNE